MAVRGSVERLRRARPLPGAQSAKAAATQAGLLAAARACFAQRGYHATGTNDLVALASVTRGALYHHFADKEALFEAVFRQVSQELVQDAAATVAPLTGDVWRQLLESLKAYLRLVAWSGEAQRILLVDGPAVFGWSRWRDLESEYILKDMTTTVRMLIERGIIRDQPPEPLARLIMAALHDSALSIAHAADPHAAFGEISDALISLIEGLRIHR